jgi:transcription-repair coupling factor (superfamily II helicase)
VERHGEFAVRGGIIDVFPVQAGHPSRLDFFGDEIEEIRPFSIGSQRSEGSATQVEIYPAGELLIDPAIRERAAELTTAESWAASTWDRIAEGISFPGIESWLPWLAPGGTLLDETAVPTVLFDPARSEDRAREAHRKPATTPLSTSSSNLLPSSRRHPRPLVQQTRPTSRARSARSKETRRRSPRRSVGGATAGSTSWWRWMVHRQRSG